MKLTVKLEAKPNPDYMDSDYRGLLNIKAQLVSVNSLKMASEVCSKFIEDNELGGGNWTGGEVKDSGGKVIAQVSYNGRVWEPLPYPICKEIAL
jgi:hypothetical protein